MRRIALFIVIGTLATTFATAQVNFTASNLPIIIIQTNGQQIPDEPKITAFMGVIDNGPGQINHPADAFTGYEGNIGIELRGSSSQFYEKKPYTIELRDAAGEDLAVPLLGMPAESDWVLIAPLNDKTLMRDVLAHHLARQALAWSPRTRYCEVVLNNTYIGVYTLVESIKRDENRVNIKKLKPEDTTGDKLTGGYMLRIDKYGPSPGTVGGDWKLTHNAAPGSSQETWIQYFTPKADEIVAEQAAYIQNHFKEFDDMMAGPNFAAEYPNWIDVDSWINYLLVEEVSKNTDGYRLSAYFYKDRDSHGGRITMGPVWDFNIAFGIGDYCQGQDWTGWAKDFNAICGGDAWIIHFWWDRLWSDPAFRQRMGDRWKELRADTWSNSQMLGTIDSISTLLGQAQVRNFQRWPVLGQYVWPNSFVGSTYGQEVYFLKNWLTKRLEWLDNNIASVSSNTLIPSQQSPFTLYPNPVRNYLLIRTNYPYTVNQNFDIRIFDLAGRLVFVRENLIGKGVLSFDLGAERLADGLYTYKISQYNKAWEGKLMIKR